MRFLKNLFQFLDRIMGIHLGSSQAAVTQQFLYSIDIRAIIHEVSGKTVAQNMRAFFLDSSNLGKVLFYKRIYRPGLKGPAFF